MAKFTGFPSTCIPFLVALSQNNDREWFTRNKLVYENSVREPALAFIQAIEPDLRNISPHFRVSAKKVGGSLMRIYRDIRYTRDKSPYKTNVGIQFRHEQGKDVHAPGFYLHIEADNCFLGAGIWRPDSAALGRLRSFIDDNPAAWRAALNQRRFKRDYQLEGETLKRPPRGYPPDHPLIDDLKRKDFIACSAFDDREIETPEFLKMVVRRYAEADDFMRYLCIALDIGY